MSQSTPPPESPTVTDDGDGNKHLTTHATVLSGTGAVQRKEFTAEMQPTALFT